MYIVDERDAVVALEGFPLPGDVPEPLLGADEHKLVLAYTTRDGIPDDGVRIGEGSWDDTEDDYVVIIFAPCYTHYLGAPNDEALGGHPLTARGLRWYGAYEIRNSSWVRSLEAMNRVHPRHNPALFSDRKHYIFTFQDSTFECVSRGFEVRYFRGTRHSMRTMLQELLGGAQPN